MTAAEIDAAIDRVRTKARKGPGPKGIPNSMWTIVHQANPGMLDTVFNSVLKSRIFPNGWKVSRLGACHRPPKRISRTKSISEFCTYFVQFCIPSPKVSTPFLLALSAIQIWGLVTCSPPRKYNLKIKNCIIILYSFCTPSSKFNTPFLLPLSAIPIWRGGDM